MSVRETMTLALACGAVLLLGCDHKKTKEDNDDVPPHHFAETQRRQLKASALLNVPVQASVDVGAGVIMEFALIPSGLFTMGSPETDEARSESEHPQRVVTITRAFYIGIHEVTQAQYEAVTGENPSVRKRRDHPVECVSWEDVQLFCSKLSSSVKRRARLPTEAEWEYACRAGAEMRYCWGDEVERLKQYAWFYRNSDSAPHAVRLKKPNAWGLYDMHGNLSELCADWYDRNHYASTGECQDPTGPDTGLGRVIRGGDYASDWPLCRSAHRSWLDPGAAEVFVGFRVVLECPTASSGASTSVDSGKADQVRRATVR